MNSASEPQPHPGFDHALARPAAASFRQTQIHLRDLRLLERGVRRREIRAGVDHLAIQPEPVELVAEVVVVMDVLARGAHVVRALPQPPGPRRRASRARDRSRFEQRDQIAADLDGAEHVGFAEIEIGIPHPAEQRAAVLEDDGRHRRRPAVDGSSNPSQSTNRIGADATRALDPRERPAIQRGGGGRRDLTGKGRNRKRAQRVLAS